MMTWMAIWLDVRRYDGVYGLVYMAWQKGLDNRREDKYTIARIEVDV